MIENRVTKALGALFQKRSVVVGPTSAIGLPYGDAASPVSISASLRLSAAYRCVEVISSAIASEYWDILEWTKPKGWSPSPFHKSEYMLNNEPNTIMSRFTLMKTLITKVLLEGNGYLHIIRNGIGDPVELRLINDSVQAFMKLDGSGLYYIVAKDTGKDYRIEDSEMIHILNFSYNGIVGVSTLTHAMNTMEVSNASEASAKGFFKSGANMSGIISVENNKLTKEKAEAIKDSWSQAFDITSGAPGGIAVMESGLNFHPVTVNPKEAQMLETREFNVIEICRFFGVSPSKVFDSKNLTYTNIESFQLGFLTDTISPLNSKIESEFNRKLFRPSKRRLTKLNLNIGELLKADMDSTANYYTKMLGVGAYTSNEIRKKIGQPEVKGGNQSFRPMNYMPLDVKVTQNTKIDKNIKVKDEEEEIKVKE